MANRVTIPYSLLPIRYSLHACHVVAGLLSRAVALERAVVADRVEPLEDPVLPCGEPREDFRFHGLGAGEAQIGFHAGEAVRREAGALLQEHADLIVPVDIIKCEGDEAELLGVLGLDRLAELAADTVEIGWIGLESR